MPSTRKHQVALRLDDEAFAALDVYAARHRWSRAAAAEAIVASYLALEPIVAKAEVSQIAQQLTLDDTEDWQSRERPQRNTEVSPNGT